MAEGGDALTKQVVLHEWQDNAREQKRARANSKPGYDAEAMERQFCSTSSRYLLEALFLRWAHRIVERHAHISLEDLREKMNQNKLHQSDKLNSLLLLQSDGSVKSLLTTCFVAWRRELELHQGRSRDCHHSLGHGQDGQAGTLLGRHRGSLRGHDGRLHAGRLRGSSRGRFRE